MEIEVFELKNMLADAAELGSKRALVEIGKLSPMITKAQAYKLHGRSQVDRWIKEGLLRQYKDGENTSKVRIDRMQLETIAKSSNRASYFSTK
jgi:hypothetical protein